KRNRQHRVAMEQFEGDGHIAVLILYGARRDAAKGGRRQREGDRNAALVQHAAHAHAALADGEGDLAEIVLRGIAYHLGQMERIKPHRAARPDWLETTCHSMCLPVSPESRCSGSLWADFPVSYEMALLCRLDPSHQKNSFNFC